MVCVGLPVIVIIYQKVNKQVHKNIWKLKLQFLCACQELIGASVSPTLGSQRCNGHVYNKNYDIKWIPYMCFQTILLIRCAQSIQVCVIVHPMEELTA